LPVLLTVVNVIEEPEQREVSLRVVIIGKEKTVIAIESDDEQPPLLVTVTL